MNSPQVNEHINQGIVVGDSLAVAQLGLLKAQGDGLAVDALGGAALVVELFESVTLAVELVADTSTG